MQRFTTSPRPGQGSEDAGTMARHSQADVKSWSCLGVRLALAEQRTATAMLELTWASRMYWSNPEHRGAGR